VTLHGSLIESLEGVVALVDGETGGVRSTKDTEVLLGRAPVDRKHFVELLTADEATAVQVHAALDQAREGNEVSVPLAGVSSRKMAAEVWCCPLGDREHHDVVVLVSCPLFDVYRRKLRARKDRLTTVGQLSAGMTHELNNILTAIIGWTQIALRDPSRVEVVESALSVMDENCRRAKGIIDDLMGFVRDDASGEMHVQPADIADDVLRVLAWELDNAGVSVNRGYRAVPPVRGDRRRLFQVFLNIVLNAMQAMPEGGKLTITTVREGDSVRVAFQDTGTGMDAETAAMVFEPLFTTKSSSGLGLALCREIVEQHCGSIGVVSEPGAGSTFTVELPAAEELRTTQHPVPGVGQKPPAGLAILVVEAERDVREMISAALRMVDVPVTAVSSGVEAMAVCRRQEFDVAFIDATLPGTSCAFLAGKLRELSPGVRIVTVSGRGDAQGPEVTGADGFLRKPFDLEKLFALVRPRNDTLPT
jgi:nitrogen-specific signal transduction histidine kinase